MILRRYGLTLNIKRRTIEYNEHRDMVLLHFMGLFPRLLFFSYYCILAVQWLYLVV